MQTITKELISPFTTDMKEHKDLFRTAYVSTADVQTITRLQYGRNQTVPSIGTWFTNVNRPNDRACMYLGIVIPGKPVKPSEAGCMLVLGLKIV
jgi:hypothetical protein